MRDLHLERVLESFHGRFWVSLEHAEVDTILQPFKSRLSQKTHDEAIGAYRTTFMAVGCGSQADDRDEDDREPDQGHTQSA